MVEIIADDTRRERTGISHPTDPTPETHPTPSDAPEREPRPNDDPDLEGIPDKPGKQPDHDPN